MGATPCNALVKLKLLNLGSESLHTALVSQPICYSLWVGGPTKARLCHLVRIYWF